MPGDLFHQCHLDLPNTQNIAFVKEILSTLNRQFWLLQAGMAKGSFCGPSNVGLHIGTRVPIGTEIHFGKYLYFTVSLRTGTKRHCFIYEHRFILTNETSCYLLAPTRTANPITHHVLFPPKKFQTA